MKNLVDFITESLKITKDSKIDTAFGKKISIDDVEWSTNEPSKDKSPEFIQIQTAGKTWKDQGDDVYVKIDSIPDKSEEAVLSLAYKLMKEVYLNGTHADINIWDDKEGQWSTFASSWLQTKNRMWHPEWTNGVFK